MANAILEIRAGTGGQEAELFASDLWRMYQRYAQKENWRIKPILDNRNQLGGIKTLKVEIAGDKPYEKLKYESGIHRVQRVPATEKRGRVHTSAASVSILPVLPEAKVNIDPKDLAIDVFRASGHGGQNVNKLSTAVRITHLPTGLVVSCQDERSQGRNKEKALNALYQKLKVQADTALKAKIDNQRQQAVGSGDRSDKIRTYNFPQDRITDHRIKKTWNKIEKILDGNIERVLEKTNRLMAQSAS